MRWSAIIIQIRVTKELKQQALASLLGVSQSAVSRWENNQDEPNLATAKQLLAMASPPPVGTLELFSAEADAQFCPLAISTVDPLRLVRWNEPLARRWRLDPRPGDAAHRFMESTWFDHYPSERDRLAPEERPAVLRRDQGGENDAIRQDPHHAVPAARIHHSADPADLAHEVSGGAIRDESYSHRWRTPRINAHTPALAVQLGCLSIKPHEMAPYGALLGK